VSAASARLDFPGAGGEPRTLLFSNPVELIVAEEAGAVREALRAVERAAARGYYVVGYLSYEAAPAYDAAHLVRAGAHLPLAWFGVYRAPIGGEGGGVVADNTASVASGEMTGETTSSYQLSGWEPDTPRASYDAAIAALQEAFRAGDVDQVNYTLRLRARGAGAELALYRQLLAAQGSAYGAYLDLGTHRILSASPELFFRREGDRILTRPMKGTARRGRWPEEDEAAAAALATSAKDRAENLMTVEWLRAELERLARPGMVEVAAVCEVERYPTVFQLTSTLSAELVAGTSLESIFAGLFPSVSVTGVPKLAALRRIATLEAAPREVYCGAIGVVEPGGDAVFNVAIRTVWIDTATGVAEYGVGGGITRASTAAGEYDEVLAKSAVLTRTAPTFELLETLRLADGRYARLEGHLARLGASARYFGWPDPVPVARAALAEHARLWPRDQRRVRVLADAKGGVRVESEPFEGGGEAGEGRDGWLVGLARTPVSRHDLFLHHKTTNRAVHKARLAERSGLSDVLLWNEAGELTEFSRGNLVIELDGVRWTPPPECGLLAGIFRAELLGRGEIRERVLREPDLLRASRVWLINSLREWVPVRVAGERGDRVASGSR
jgi:para-aminobenzoate synthetase/4-amino-4-deoxychorismate lyase